MLHFYDYIFYRIYKSTNIINKSIPEWSTIITIATIVSINIFSLIIYFDFPIESIGRNGFGLMPLIIIAIHYFIFLSNKRHRKIISHFNKSKNRNNLFHDILILSYCSVSIYILFNLLGMELKSSMIVISTLAATSTIVYLYKKLR